MTCCVCGKAILHDEIAMTRRLVCKTADEFFCLGCLSVHLDIPKDELLRKMAYFKAMGCVLFEQDTEKGA